MSKQKLDVSIRQNNETGSGIDEYSPGLKFKFADRSKKHVTQIDASLYRPLKAILSGEPNESPYTLSNSSALRRTVLKIAAALKTSDPQAHAQLTLFTQIAKDVTKRFSFSSPYSRIFAKRALLRAACDEIPRIIRKQALTRLLIAGGMALCVPAGIAVAGYLSIQSSLITLTAPMLTAAITTLSIVALLGLAALVTSIVLLKRPPAAPATPQVEMSYLSSLPRRYRFCRASSQGPRRKSFSSR